MGTSEVRLEEAEDANLNMLLGWIADYPDGEDPLGTKRLHVTNASGSWVTETVASAAMIQQTSSVIDNAVRMACARKRCPA